MWLLVCSHKPLNDILSPLDHSAYVWRKRIITASAGRSKTGWYIAAAIIVVVLIVAGVIAYQETRSPSPTPSPSPSASPSTSASTSPAPSSSTVTVDIYAGEVSSSQYGFGTNASSITSPGPSLNFKVGSTVTINFHNNGTMGHNFAIVNTKTDGNPNLAFNGAQVASASNPVAPGGTGSCTFILDKYGTYYYICQVDDHVSLGMWGTVTVTG